MEGLAICQRGFGSLMKNELSEIRKLKFTSDDDIKFVFKGEFKGNSVFPHWIANDINIIQGEKVDELAGQIFDFFYNRIKDKKIEEKWYLTILDSQKEPGIAKRGISVANSLEKIIKKRMSRVSKLMKIDKPDIAGEYQGLFIFIDDFNKIFVATNFIFNGQKRMADDNLAPSRSYLKVEEAYNILGHEPSDNDIVVDLGAAPGGWSYSAAKRGATVYAIDNGPMKAGAKDNIQIIHLKTDAFKYTPATKVDWLFCDMVEEPHHVMKLIESWIADRKCRFFVVNLKFGHTNPIKLIAEIESGIGGFKDKTLSYKLRHIYHDRDEFTITGMVY